MTDEYGRDELQRTPRGLWITTFLSQLLSFGAGVAWSSYAWPVPYGARGHAIVTDVKIIRLPIRPLYLPSIEYRAGGVTYDSAAVLPNAFPIYSGQLIALDYDPKHPAHGRVAYEMDALVIYLTVIVVFALGALLFRFVRRRPRVIETKAIPAAPPYKGAVAPGGNKPPATLPESGVKKRWANDA